MILDSDGNVLHDILLPEQGANGNGKGAPAAPTTMDLNGDGTVEIVVQTFGVGCFVFTVPGSAENKLLWPTGRGNYLRDGRPWPDAVKDCSGDFDEDEDVDENDLAIFASFIGRSNCGESPSCEGDFDSDGDVDSTDLAAFETNFRKTVCP